VVLAKEPYTRIIFPDLPFLYIKMYIHFAYRTFDSYTVEISQGNGPIRHVETCPDFFFTARAHTKSSVKILAANTHCKYFQKIAENGQYCSLPDPWRNVHP
jgi:hypothetical protein